MPVKGPKNHNENGMLPSQSKDAILKLKNVVSKWHAYGYRRGFATIETMSTATVEGL